MTNSISQKPAERLAAVPGSPVDWAMADADIARQRGVSRQAVNRMRRHYKAGCPAKGKTVDQLTALAKKWYRKMAIEEHGPETEWTAETRVRSEYDMSLLACFVEECASKLGANGKLSV